MHLISDSLHQDFVPCPNQHSRRLCLQPVLPELVRWRRAGPGVSCILSKSDTPCATGKGKEKSQRFGQDLVPTKQLSSTFIGSGWHQVERAKETPEKYCDTATTVLPYCGGSGNTTRGFLFSSRLPQHFVFLFGNKWN